VVEDNLSSTVTCGENGGHQLQHDSVVRQMSIIGKLVPGGSRSFQTAVAIDPSWKLKDLRLVVFAQDQATGAIVATREKRFN